MLKKISMRQLVYKLNIFQVAGLPPIEEDEDDDYYPPVFVKLNRKVKFRYVYY